MRDAQMWLEDVAAAVADKATFDWDAAETSATDETERALIRQLRLIGEIARARSTSTGLELTSGTLDESILHPPGANDGWQEGQPVSWGPLRIVEKVGRGRFGDVYRAWDPRLAREVALKLLRRRDTPAADDDESLVVDEGRLMARVRHPNVATIYGAERIGERTGLWMEFVEGRTLEQEVGERGRFSADEVAAVGIELCGALAAVHDAGLVHRDVKTHNVLRERTGRLVLSDFGTGHELDDVEASLAGTPLYLAPEVFSGSPATPRSDIYALGVLLFHLATDSYPANGRSLREIREAHRQGAHTPLERLRPDFPSQLATAIERALAVDPGVRFQTARDMEAAIGQAVTPAPAIETPGQRLGRLLMIAATATVTIVAGAMMWQRVGSQSPRTPPSPSSLAAQPSGLQSVNFRQVSPDPALAGPGGPSPDGRLLSFVDLPGNLLIYDVATRERRQVVSADGTSGAGSAETTQFSPDGSRLAYVWYSKDRTAAEIRTIAVEGGSPTTVWRAPAQTEIRLYEWSRSGQNLLVALTIPGGVDLAIVSLSGSAKTVRHVARANPPYNATLSPDGGFIAYDMPDPITSKRDIFAVSEDGSLNAAVVQGPADDHSPLWTRDGRLLFLSDRSTGNVGLWIVRIVGAQVADTPAPIETNLGEGWMMGLTDAGSLFVRRQIGLRSLHVADLDPATGAVAGGRSQPVSASIGNSGSADWSPDGKRLAFFRRRYDDMRLVIHDFTTGREREISKPWLSGIVKPRWMPDARSILMTASYQEKWGLYLIDLKTEQLTFVMPLQSSAHYEVVAGGAAILGRRLPLPEIFQRDLRTGREDMVLKWPREQNFGTFAASPDLNRIALVRGKTPSLWVVTRSEPPTERELFTSGADDLMEVYAWTTDGKGILVKRAKQRRTLEPYQSDESRLWRIDAETGEARLLGLELNGLNQLRLSPDGRRIAFDAGWPYQQVWMLEHFLNP